MNIIQQILPYTDEYYYSYLLYKRTITINCGKYLVFNQVSCRKYKVYIKHILHIITFSHFESLKDKDEDYIDSMVALLFVLVFLFFLLFFMIKN